MTTFYLALQVQNIQEHGTKIGLNIAINAPRILIPCHSRSHDMLVTDLGQLLISNSITQMANGVLVDNMDVQLSSFKVSGYVNVLKWSSLVFSWQIMCNS